MIAQTMVEYGGLNAIAAAISSFFNRLETYVWSGNSKYYLFLALAVIVTLALTRRRRHG
jgi:MYXO-CTERM domain-containing protein